MLEITNAAASAAILAACDEGRLVQRSWHDRGKDGRELACLLGSIHPSVESAEDCNGYLMPMWLAELTATLFDGIAAEHMVPMARRYGELVARWHALTPAMWDRIRTKFLIRTIDAAVEAAAPINVGKPYWPAVAAACEQVKTALVSGVGLEAAAAMAAAMAARAAAMAARAARAAAMAARAAMAAARAARAARAAAMAAGTAAVYLSLFTFLLDQIAAHVAEAEIASREDDRA